MSQNAPQVFLITMLFSAACWVLLHPMRQRCWLYLTAALLISAAPSAAALLSQALNSAAEFNGLCYGCQPASWPCSWTDLGAAAVLHTFVSTWPALPLQGSLSLLMFLIGLEQPRTATAPAWSCPAGREKLPEYCQPPSARR